MKKKMIFLATLSLMFGCLGGCEKTEPPAQGQEKTAQNPVEQNRTEAGDDTRAGAAADLSAGEEKGDAPGGQGNDAAGENGVVSNDAAEENGGTGQNSFPAEYHNTVNGVTFDLQVEVPAQAELAHLTRDTAVRQYPDIEQAIRAYAQGKTVTDEKRDQVTEENGRNYSCYYGKYEDGSYLYLDNTFSCGASDAFEKIRSAFHVEKMWGEYNADQYLSGQEFSFATKAEALEKVTGMVASAGYELGETESVCYSLDAQTMAQQERSYDMEGNVITGQYEWDASDNGYYFFLKQMHHGLPVYFGREPFLDDGEDSMPVQAVYTENGFVRLDVTWLYTFTNGTEPVALLDFDAAVEAVASKYGDVLSEVNYLIRRATLYEMPIATQSGEYEVKPVWQFEVKESGFDSELGRDFENTLFTFIDAETGKEIVLS